jgi:hypothetical protein
LQRPRSVHYAALQYELHALFATDRRRLTQRQRDGLKQLGRWYEKNQEASARSLVEWHRPVSSGRIERPLRAIKNSIYDRRRNFKNMDRRDHLLILLQLEQMGYADDRAWAEILREDHGAREGRPPERRLIDDPMLYSRW